MLNRIHRHFLKILSMSDDWLQFALGFVLLVVAVILIGQTVLALPEVLSIAHYQEGMLTVIHDIMLVMIVLELLWTVLTYLREHSVPLEPFLFVGIISSIRKLLLISAQMSLSELGTELGEFQLREIAYHGGLVFVLVLSLALVRYTKRWGRSARAAKEGCVERPSPVTSTEA